MIIYSIEYQVLTIILLIFILSGIYAIILNTTTDIEIDDISKDIVKDNKEEDDDDDEDEEEL